MRIENRTRSTLLADSAETPRGFWGRLVGLMGRRSLQPGGALVLDPCTSIHTAFMRFPIDVVYVDRANKVVKVCSDLKPFRVSGVLRGGRAVIELPSGVIADTGTAPGDELVFDS